MAETDSVDLPPSSSSSSGSWSLLLPKTSEHVQSYESLLVGASTNNQPNSVELPGEIVADDDDGDKNIVTPIEHLTDIKTESTTQYSESTTNT